MSGFVWIEAGRLVGNVTVYRAETQEPAWVIANVAVHPDYRRRGIAREMLLASLDSLRRKYPGQRALLQVMHDNDPAIRLYRSLGFFVERTWTTWRRSGHLTAPIRRLALEPVRTVADAHALYALACAVRPGGLGWMRSLTPGAFRVGFWRALGDALSGRQRQHYLLRDAESGRAVAGLQLVASLGGGTDKFTLLVHPRVRDALTRPMLDYALWYLGGGGHTIVTEHPHDDAVATAVLRALGFSPRFVFTHMRYDL
jgi:hypothetical protein